MERTRKVLKYDENLHPLRAMVERHFCVRDLVELHDTLEDGGAGIARLEVGKDQQTVLHQRFYGINGDFHDAYRRFVKEVAAPLAGHEGPLLFQKVPTFRVHLPGNVATGGFHRDRDYNHYPEELNFVVALTPMQGTSSIWMETQEGLRDFIPINLLPGEVLRFDGANLEHGSHPNNTGRTRVSLDFRLLPEDVYEAKYAAAPLKTVNKGVELKVGGYFERLE